MTGLLVIAVLPAAGLGTLDVDPTGLVLSRLHGEQRAIADQIPLEQIFQAIGFESGQPLPILFQDLESGKGVAYIARGLARRDSENLALLTVQGTNANLNLIFDTGSRRLASLSYQPSPLDSWRSRGWTGTPEQMIQRGTSLVSSQYGLEGGIVYQPGSEGGLLGVRPNLRFDWTVDGRLVGAPQTATVKIDSRSGAVLSYIGQVGAIVRRPVRENEARDAQASLEGRLATRFGSGFYQWGQNPLAYLARSNDRWNLYPAWSLSCTEFDHLGKTAAFLQITIDPDSRQVIAESRGESGFGGAALKMKPPTADTWKHGDVEGQIKATDRKATQGGVQRTLTSGNRLLVGTFYAAERLLEVKGVFFEVDPALSKALAIAQPPASLNYGQ
jgi:hypothetical protein